MIAWFSAHGQGASIWHGPLPYAGFDLSAGNTETHSSPFANVPFKYFHLEDFEDETLNTPGVTVSAGTIGNGGAIDSVDADDGLVEGSGSTGRSWYASGSTNLTFTFDRQALGELPTHAGLVWTDVGFGGGFYGQVLFEAFGPETNSLGTIGPVSVGDGSDSGETSEDRFFGVSFSNGISAIRIAMIGTGDFEVDHLQYGREARTVSGVQASIRKAVEISWSGETNSFYQVQWASRLNTNRWWNFGKPVTGTNALYDPVDWREDRFYRVLQIE